MTVLIGDSAWSTARCPCPPKMDALNCAPNTDSFTVTTALSHRVYFLILCYLNAIFSRFSIMFSKSEIPDWNAESSTDCYTAWCRLASLPLSTGVCFPLSIPSLQWLSTHRLSTAACRAAADSCLLWHLREPLLFFCPSPGQPPPIS